VTSRHYVTTILVAPQTLVPDAPVGMPCRHALPGDNTDRHRPTPTDTHNTAGRRTARNHKGSGPFRGWGGGGSSGEPPRTRQLPVSFSRSAARASSEASVPSDVDGRGDATSSDPADALDPLDPADPVEEE
jgi:hypothetical protein